MPTPSSPKETPSGYSVERTQLLGKREFDLVFTAWLTKIRQALQSEKVKGGWALVGIKRRGALLARRLWNHLSSKDAPLLYGEVDISLYRDDYHLQKEYHLEKAGPQVLGTVISFRVDGVKILLVDDVLYTGRTVRAAMDLILDFGRPRVISLTVFVDRGHRELPIAANFVGKEMATERDHHLHVKRAALREEDAVE